MNRKKPRLSAVVIAKNEAPRIAKCVKALSFADEVIVVDNSSTDDTAAVAAASGALVRTLKVDGFATLRNKAAEFVRSDWVLYVDADEVVTPALAAEIKQVVRNASQGEASGFELYRKNYYLGAPWPKGEWMLRLFRVDALDGWQGQLHETALVRGKVGRLQGGLLHDTHRTLTEMVDKTNEWSQTEAALRVAAHHPPITWWRIIRVMLTGFWDSYIGQGGWRAGATGWIESIFQAFSMFITYAKLWELQQKHTHE